MDKRKNYLVYDGDDETPETDNLRERLNNEVKEEIEPPKKDSGRRNRKPERSEKPEKPERPQKVKKDKKSNRKIVEKILIGLIVMVLLSIAGVLGIYAYNKFFTPNIDVPVETVGRIDPNLDMSKLTAADTFTVISENSATIVEYVIDIRDLSEAFPSDFKEQVAAYKSMILADISTFTAYQPLYDKYQGTKIHSEYSERLLNVLSLLDAIKNIQTQEEAVTKTNTFILTENALNTRSITDVIQWLDTNQLDYEIVNDRIILK